MVKLSVIIPAYNEEKNIGRTLRAIVNFFGHLRSYDYEIIVIDDGSRDLTSRVVRATPHKKVKLIRSKRNYGKGHALRLGVKAAKGSLVTFNDAGGDFEPENIVRCIKLMEALDADIVIGSKRHPMSRVNYPLKRRFFSRIYQLMIRLLFNLKVRDTQTGLKVFRREVLQAIIPRALVKQYAFDLELLVIANHLGYHRITEAPVDLDFNPSTTGINSSAIRGIIQDTLAIFYRLHILRWYDRKTKL